MTSPWVFHEHHYEPCGCGIVFTKYTVIEGDKYADGTNRITLLHCSEHPQRGLHLDDVHDALPEVD